VTHSVHFGILNIKKNIFCLPKAAFIKLKIVKTAIFWNLITKKKKKC